MDWGLASNSYLGTAKKEDLRRCDGRAARSRGCKALRRRNIELTDPESGAVHREVCGEALRGSPFWGDVSPSTRCRRQRCFCFYSPAAAPSQNSRVPTAAAGAYQRTGPDHRSPTAAKTRPARERRTPQR